MKHTHQKRIAAYSAPTLEGGDSLISPFQFLDETLLYIYRGSDYYASIPWAVTSRLILAIMP